MIDHVTIRVSDRAASERFYDTVLPVIGITRNDIEEYAEWGDYSMSDEVSDEHPLTQRLHIGFRAPSREHVDRFWQAGVDAGYRSDGEPGPREYTKEYYGSFLLDPDGNSVEAVIHEYERSASIDHVWMRVADLDASRRFYETIAPFTGFTLSSRRDDRASFSSGDGSFSVVPGDPTQGVHMAFSADDNATVEAFHSAATAAGYRDFGAPGERPIYHEGYYGAFVLDPDGNNIEVVNHNR
jgi:catechol 2,3-dioxygenase-like lactoylglutathione lyase family enzyme